MDSKKNLSEKAFKAASSVTKKAEAAVKISKYKIDLKLINKDIEKIKLYIGTLVYKWYNDNEIDKSEIIRGFTDIMELEEKANEIHRKISKLKVEG